MSPSDFRGRRVLVTGGGGFIGRQVCRLLLEAGADHVRSVQASDENPPDDVETVVADLRDPAVGRQAMRTVTDVVHLAARSGGIQLQTASHGEVVQDNLAMTSSVLQAAAECGAERVFLASSAVVYDEGGTVPFSENAPVLRPGQDNLTGYAWAKLTDEALAGWAVRQGTPVVVGRFANVYGPGGDFSPGRATVVHALVARACAQPEGGALEVWGRPDVVRSFVYVEDAARAVVTLLRHGASGGVYNIDSESPVSMHELASAVVRASGKNLHVVFDAARPSGPDYRVLSASRLSALGFRCLVSLDEGLTTTVAAYLQVSRG